MSFNFSLYQAARKAKRAVKRDEKFAKEYQDQESNETRPGTPFIDVTGQKTKSTVPKNW